MSNIAGSTKALKAVIIGCGAIAGGYDESYSGPDILTHAKAYRMHPEIDLVGCIEPDDNRRQQFMKAWGVGTGFSTLDELASKNVHFDIASVCVPTSEHANILEKLLSTAVKGVFCEKPISDELKTSTRLVNAYAKATIPLAVNYLRRWDESLESLKSAIDSGAWGALQTAACHYGKGMRHNGSHMIDVLQFLFGHITPLAVLRRQTDFEEADPTLDAVLKTQSNAPIHLLGTDSRLFDVFEACLTFEKGQVVLEQGMDIIRERHIEDDRRFGGHRSLETGTPKKSSLGLALYRGLDNLYKAVTENVPLASDGRTALAAQEVCEQLLTMAPQA